MYAKLQQTSRAFWLSVCQTAGLPSVWLLNPCTSLFRSCQLLYLHAYSSTCMHTPLPAWIYLYLHTHLTSTYMNTPTSPLPTWIHLPHLYLHEYTYLTSTYINTPTSPLPICIWLYLHAYPSTYMQCCSPEWYLNLQPVSRPWITSLSCLSIFVKIHGLSGGSVSWFSTDSLFFFLHSR